MLSDSDRKLAEAQVELLKYIRSIDATEERNRFIEEWFVKAILICSQCKDIIDSPSEAEQNLDIDYMILKLNEFLENEDKKVPYSGPVGSA